MFLFGGLINLVYTRIFSGSNVYLQLNRRAMAELQILRLFGNPLEFLPEILPLHKLRHLSLANIRIVADENLRSVNVQIEVVVCCSYNSYFGYMLFKLVSKVIFLLSGDCRWRIVLILVHLDTS